MRTRCGDVSWRWMRRESRGRERGGVGDGSGAVGQEGMVARSEPKRSFESCGEGGGVEVECWRAARAEGEALGGEALGEVRGRGEVEADMGGIEGEVCVC